MLPVFAISAFIVSAPALKSDSITGELRYFAGDSAVVVRQERTPEGTFAEVTYWLVFQTAEKESDTRKLGNGVPVKATGTIGNGGIYRYVIVEKVTKE